MSAAFPAFQPVSPHDRGAAVVVLGYACVFTSIIFTAIRLVTSRILKRAFYWDDGYVLAATVLALAQTITTERAVAFGLGRHMSTLQPANIESYYKAIYASQLLAIAVLALAKASSLVLIQRLTALGSAVRRICNILLLTAFSWAVISTLLLAFQCGTTRPWVYNANVCIGRGALWYPVVAMSILTDFIIAVFFLPAIWKLHMQRSRKLLVGVLFGSRVLVGAAGIAQLVILPAAIHSVDQTWSTVNLAILIQIVMNLSIITTHVPSLSRFFSELQIGSGTRFPVQFHDLTDRTSAAAGDPSSAHSKAKSSDR